MAIRAGSRRAPWCKGTSPFFPISLPGLKGWYPAQYPRRVWKDGAVQLNAADKSALFATTTFNPGASDFALAFSLYADTLPVAQTIYISGASYDGQDGFWIRLLAAGSLAIYFNDSVQGTSVFAVVPLGLTTATWYNIVINFDRDGVATVYKNAIADATTLDISGHSASLGASARYMGAFNATSENFDGRLDSFFFWTRLLTQDEITFLHNGGAAQVSDNLGVAGTAGANLRTGAAHFYDLGERTGIRYDSFGTNHLTQVFGEKVTNGGFTTDTSGWTAGSGTLASVAGGQSGNCLQITNNAATNGYAYQAQTTIAGKLYQASVYEKNGSNAGGVYAGTAPAGSDLFPGATCANAGSWGSTPFTIRATGATSYISLWCNGGALGNTVLWDTISFKAAEILGADGVAEGLAQDANFAAQFNGTTQYLSKASNASLQTGDVDFQAWGWIYLNAKPTGSGQAVLLSKWNGTGNLREYQVTYYATSDRFTFSVSSDGTIGNSTTLEDSSLGAPSIGNWYFVNAWHDSVNDKIWIQTNNGTPVSANWATGLTALTADFNIGASAGSSLLNGRATGCGFAKIAGGLTASERTWLFNNGKGRQAWEFGVTGTDGARLTAANGLVSVWDFDERSGATRSDSVGTNHLADNGTVTQGEGVNYIAGIISTLKDSSGNGRHAVQATLAAKPSFVTVGVDSPLFDGVNDLLDLGSDFISTSAFTVTAWIKPLGWGGAGFGRIVDNQKFYVYVDASKLNTTSDAATVASSAAASLALNTWYHIAVTRAADGKANLYINGALSGTANQASGTPAAGTSNVFLGNNVSGNRGFDGYINDPVFCSRVLSLAEIAQVYNYDKARYA